MNESEIIEALRDAAATRSPSQLGLYLEELLGCTLSQGILVSYFKRAFPRLPLRILLDAGEWHRLSHGHWTDEDFDAALTPWLAPGSQE